jgi:hypothetical protein
MAHQARVIITDDLDDLDGTEGAKTYRLAWQDSVYEVDLTDVHRDEVLHVLAPYISAARKVPTGRSRTTARRSSDTAEIRTWARANGHSVSGRESEPVRRAYENR